MVYLGGTFQNAAFSLGRVERTLDCKRRLLLPLPDSVLTGETKLLLLRMPTRLLATTAAVLDSSPLSDEEKDILMGQAYEVAPDVDKRIVLPQDIVNQYQFQTGTKLNIISHGAYIEILAPSFIDTKRKIVPETRLDEILSSPVPVR